MRRLLPLVLIALGVAFFANALHGPFVFDDVASVSDNTSLRQLATALQPPNRGEAVSGRPLVNLTLALNYAAGGLDVAGYHAANVALHLACALLLFAIVRDTAADEALAFAAAVIWMVHPLQTEAADYVSARTESAMALCLLLTLYSVMRGWRAGAVVACAAGMACKETMVVAPLLVALYDRTFVFPSWRAAWRARRGLWLSLAATWLVLAALLASAPRAHSAGFGNGGVATYALNQAVMIVRYLGLLVRPTSLVIDYGVPRPLTVTNVLPQILVVAALVVATLVALVRWPRAGFLGAWFLLALAPSSSIVPVVTEVGAERRMYLPSMAAVVLFVSLVSARLARAPRVGAAVLTGVVVACASATVARNAEYHSPLTLWQVTVERWPQGRARQNYAAALQAAGRTGEMMAQLDAAVADFPEARYDLGAQLATRGEEERGLRELETFVREFPGHPNAASARPLITRTRMRLAARATDRGIAHASAGRTADALVDFRRAVDWLPDNANTRRNLANALLDARDYRAAADEAREALRLNPADATAREILAAATASSR